MSDVLSVFSIVLVCALIIVSVINHSEREQEGSVNKIIIAVLTVLFLFTRLYRLGTVPAGINVDEAGMMYDAFCLGRYGVDRYLDSYPVYLSNFGGGQSVAYAYAVMAVTKILGRSIAGTLVARLPQVAGSLVLIVSSYLIFRERFSRRNAWIGVFLIIIGPYFIMASRWGLDCSLMLPMLTLGIFLLYLAVSRKSKLFFLLTGLVFGISLYTYALSYIIIPLFILMSLVYLLVNRKIGFVNIIFMGIPMFLLALPLMLMLMVNNGLMTEFRLFGVFTITEIIDYRGAEISLMNIIDNLGVFRTLLLDDGFNFNVNPVFGTIYLFNIPLLIAGFVLNVRNIINRRRDMDMLVLLMFFSVLVCSLIISEPNISKSNGIFFSLLYFVVVCIENMEYRKLYRIVILVNLIGFVMFSYSYYFIGTDYTFFEKDITDTVNYLDDHYPEGNVYIDLSGIEGGSIYVLLAEEFNPLEYDDPAEQMKGNVGRYYFGFNGDIGSYSYFVMKDDNPEEAVLTAVEAAGLQYELCYGYRIYRR